MDSSKNYRHSGQRDTILEYLTHSFDHPTAMTIFQDLKDSIPSLSLGNLYRNLGILVEQGHIIKVKQPGSDEDRFDAHTEEHFHFYCESCKKLFDIPAASFPDLKIAAKKLGWRAKSADVNMTGTCEQCTKAARVAESLISAK